MEFKSSAINRAERVPRQRVPRQREWLTLRRSGVSRPGLGQRDAWSVKHEVLQLDAGAPVDLLRLCTIADADLVEIDMAPDHPGNRAWLSRKDEGGFRIVVASTIDPASLPRGAGVGLMDRAPKAFAVAHEIGHLFLRGHLRHNAVPTSEAEERFCDEFAGELIADGWVL